MDQIEPYRQIVQLQAQIVKISRRNGELRKTCEELEEALSSGVANVAEEAPRDPVIHAARNPWWLRAGLKISKELNFLRPLRWLRV